MHIAVKSILILFCLLLFLNVVRAQKDTTYYLRKSGKLTSTKDSADYVLIVSPPGNSDNKDLFTVNQYYLNGSIRATGKSLVNTYPLKLQGVYTGFFPNGRKSMVRNYIDGEASGEEIEYYPNGNFYTSKTYNKHEVTLNICKDSTGQVLTENGNGRWINFDEHFNNMMNGRVFNGREEGEWHKRITDTSELINEYKKGKLVSIANQYKSGNKVYFMVESLPEFPGGLSAFAAFLSQNVVYPAAARRNGTEGRVIISFIIQKDGSLSNIQIAKGIGDGCDEEALRVIKLSPNWKPAYQDGIPVGVAFSVPIAYRLKK